MKEISHQESMTPDELFTKLIYLAWDYDRSGYTQPAPPIWTQDEEALEFLTKLQDEYKLILFEINGANITIDFTPEGQSYGRLLLNRRNKQKQ